MIAKGFLLVKNRRQFNFRCLSFCGLFPVLWSSFYRNPAIRYNFTGQEVNICCIKRFRKCYALVSFVVKRKIMTILISTSSIFKFYACV